MPLSDRQAQLFIQALDSAFDLDALTKMLRQELGINLDSITRARVKLQAITDLLAAAENEGWTSNLLQAARTALPYNLELQTAADQLGLAPRLMVALRPSPPRQRRMNTPTLEKIIRGANSMLELPAWRDKLGEIEYQVCRIDLAGHAAGTGFLVGPDLVMTCYHVVETLLKDAEKPNNLLVRFDFKITNDQKVVNPGREFTLAEDWLVDASPYNPQEALGQEDAAVQPDQLDYAILRLKSRPAPSRSANRRSTPTCAVGSRSPTTLLIWLKVIPCSSFSIRPVGRSNWRWIHRLSWV